MGYRILNVNFNEQLECEVFKGIRLTEKEIKLDVGRKNKSGEYKIEELDYFTAQYKNETDLYNDLIKRNYIDKESSTTESITITHTSRSKLIKDDVIYDDKMVSDVASFLISKKQNKSFSQKEDNPILVDNSEVVLEFIDYIKHLALDKMSRKYLLGPYPCFDDVSEEYLKSMIPQEVFGIDGSLKAKKLTGLLKDYINCSRIYEESNKNGEDRLEVIYALDNVNRKIDRFIRGNYRVFRNLVAWENRYEKVLLKELETSNDPNVKNVLSVLLTEIKMQRSYRNGRISKDTLDVFYEEKTDMFEYVPIENDYVNNEELERLYQDGGLENVMINMDTNTLYSIERNVKDIEMLSKREHNSSSFSSKN